MKIVLFEHLTALDHIGKRACLVMLEPFSLTMDTSGKLTESSVLHMLTWK